MSDKIRARLLERLTAMRSSVLAVAALFFTMGTANAVDDWNGVVNIKATYTISPTYFSYDLDVVYDKLGWLGKAWGKISLSRNDSAVQGAKINYYAHPICVNSFSSGNRYTVVGRVSKVVGGTPAQNTPFVTIEIDVLNKKIRSAGLNTLAEARASCNTQSGSFPAAFYQGYVIAQ